MHPGSASAKRVGWGEVGQVTPQSDITDLQMVAARLYCERVMVGTGWATSCRGGGAGPADSATAGPMF